jgi:adenine deaminase
MDQSILSQALVATAMGQEPADMVIRDGQWVCVQSGEIISHNDIALRNQHIAFIGSDASHTIGKNTTVIDAQGRYMVPGFLDAHMHLESGMLTISEFVSAVLPHGTTGMFIDPHEIANVFGLRGIRWMLAEARAQPSHVWVQVPSCVPSAPDLETSGASITPQDVAEAMTWPGIVGLGEVMNFPGVIAGEEKIHAEMNFTRLANKTISGHYASPDLGILFHGYLAGGPQDDHEGTRIEDAVQRIRQGLKVLLRYGSAWHDVAMGVQAIKKYNLDTRHFLLCTDDCHCQTLIEEGHVNRAIKQAIKNGLNPITAIQMATLNTAEHFGVNNEVGQLAPGRYGDILLISDINNLVIDLVIAKGQLMAKNGKLVFPSKPYSHPQWVTNSINISRKFSSADFKIHADTPKRTAHVIGIIENQAPTNHFLFEIYSREGEIKQDLSNDLAKLAVIERYTGQGSISTGLVHGFGLINPCAIASSVAHDCHNLIVVGSDDENMAIAVNELIRMNGGQIVVLDRQIIGKIHLPFGGLMSNKPATEVARQATTVLEGFKRCGCKLNNPNMQLSLLALVVIPKLRLSDRGLVDVDNFRFIPLLEPVNS